MTTPFKIPTTPVDPSVRPGELPSPEAFESMLPFYVNGTLEPAGRVAVEAYLQAHPKAAGELGFHQALQARLLEDVPAVSSEVGLDRVMARIRAESPKAANHAKAPQPTLADRLKAWLGLGGAAGAGGGMSMGSGGGGGRGSAVLKPALAVAVGVIALQFFFIAGMVGSGPNQHAMLRGASGPVTAPQGPFLKVNFKPDAREADIRLLLVHVHGSLAAGPGQLGDYYLALPPGALPAAEQALRGSPLVDGVAVVDGLPARPW
jgi:hypothetical protein